MSDHVRRAHKMDQQTGSLRDALHDLLADPLVQPEIAWPPNPTQAEYVKFQGPHVEFLTDVWRSRASHESDNGLFTYVTGDLIVPRAESLRATLLSTYEDAHEHGLDVSLGHVSDKYGQNLDVVRALMTLHAGAVWIRLWAHASTEIFEAKHEVSLTGVEFVLVENVRRKK